MPAVDIDFLRGWLAGGFHDFLKMEILDYDPEAKVLRMALPFRPEYSRLPSVGDYHGGIIGALLDVVGTFVAALAAGVPAATMNLRTDYLRAPIKCDLIATGRIVRAGRTAIVADAELTDSDGRSYAVARGTWTPLGSPSGVPARAQGK